MPNITLDAIVLDGDLRWTDEFKWSSIERSTQYSLTGALILESSEKLAGRPITLEAVNEFKGPIWLTRDKILALYAKAESPAESMTLTLSDGRVFTVAFRDQGINAEPVYHVMAHEDTDPYYLTLMLQTV